MYKINIPKTKNAYQLEELIKIFLRPDQYQLTDEGCADVLIPASSSADWKLMGRALYDKLSALTGKRPEWGILTGIRPVKLCGELLDTHGSTEKVLQILKNEFYLSEENAGLIMDICLYQRQILDKAPPDSAGVYIGIPFCPTRCVYCSFASNQVSDSEIERYLQALHREIEYTGRRMRETGLKAESVYIGGGTPTTLNEAQLYALLEKTTHAFDFSALKEFTVEAGRPDTITEEKLQIMRSFGVGRISINPQTMKQETLQLIGRMHSVEAVKQAFSLAEKAGFSAVNADIIAGLPEEDGEDFRNTLRQVLALGAENITVHCLAVKRASRLIDIDPDFHYRQAEVVSGMLADSRTAMENAGYRPYYLYRQKHMAGAYENIGYGKPGKECIYNIRIMDEHQSIVALGAGGITKVYFPEENRLERVPNVTNYQQYIDRIDEMLERKEKGLFTEVKTWQS